jgi:hypothetical protein
MTPYQTPCQYFCRFQTPNLPNSLLTPFGLKSCTIRHHMVLEGPPMLGYIDIDPSRHPSP